MEGISSFLDERKHAGLLRGLKAASHRKDGIICVGGRDYIDFSSNDYLGLTNHPALKEAAKKAIDSLGTGSSASRLLSGDLEIHHRLEEETALLKNKESALIFNSGYQANLGIINALCSKGDVIFFDRLSHASITEGILLSRAGHFRFRHNDCGHLKFLLEKKRSDFRNAFIITETVFSMDGDIAPLEDIVELKEQYDCKIMVDEAHATGIFGENGAGIVEEKNLSGRVDFIMGTFSKALGSFGAYFACSGKVKEYLINTCRSFIYSTALPPSVIAANLSSLRLLKEAPCRRGDLLDKAGYLRALLRQKGFSVKGSSQIIPIVVGESEKAVNLSRALMEKGWWVLPIRQPTVPAGEARLRFSLICSHTREMLERLVSDVCACFHV